MHFFLSIPRPITRQRAIVRGSTARPPSGRQRGTRGRRTGFTRLRSTADPVTDLEATAWAQDGDPVGGPSGDSGRGKRNRIPPGFGRTERPLGKQGARTAIAVAIKSRDESRRAGCHVNREAGDPARPVGLLQKGLGRAFRDRIGLGPRLLIA